MRHDDDVSIVAGDNDDDGEGRDSDDERNDDFGTCLSRKCLFSFVMSVQVGMGTEASSMKHFSKQTLHSKKTSLHPRHPTGLGSSVVLGCLDDFGRGLVFDTKGSSNNNTSNKEKHPRSLQ